MANTKTPAMLLQEFTVRKKMAPPEYDLILCKSGTHENEFHYKVRIGNIESIGMGRSKQVAKHDAAFKAIEMLSKCGIYDDQDSPPSDFNPKMHRNEPDHPYQPAVNCIGTLQDLCCENKIPCPEFIEISDVGPPHFRQFTWECRLSSLKTQATANTKKQAKQLAAKYMLERVRDILPEICSQFNESKNCLTLGDTDVLDRYADLSFFNVVPDKSAKVMDFPFCFIKLMEDRNLKFEDFSDLFEHINEDSLKEILEKMELEYNFFIIQEKPINLISLNVSTDTPFSIIGSGPDSDTAKNEAINSTFETMKNYMQIQRPKF